MNRFRGALIALAALVVVGGGYAVITYNMPGPDEPVVDTPGLFAFEKEDLTGFRIVRPDVTIDVVKEGERWIWKDTTWRPSSSMVRRVGHQMHDLTARASVASGGETADYGLGEGAVEVELQVGDKKLRFQAGQPNPTSVSWYIRPTSGEREVYVVKKSAVDFWSMDVEDFRERRFASLDADEADYVKAVVDGRTIEVRRVDERNWQMSEPVAQAADRQMVRTMLGRTASLRATSFVEDEPSDLSKYGLQTPRHSVIIHVGDLQPVTLHIGGVVPDSEPQERYMLRVEDNSVFSARDSFLDAYMRDVGDYRDKVILGLHEFELTEVISHRDGEVLQIMRGPDGWRWQDGAKISGSTPSRLASRVAEASARAFHDEELDAEVTGFAEPAGVVEVVSESGKRVMTFGASREIPVGVQQAPEVRRYVKVDGDAVVYEIDNAIFENMEALFREHGRKVEKDAEKGLLEELPDGQVPPEQPGG
ncbi:MAG: hypothetical protein ACI9MC_000711 [Kiritimatiellia bacterium]|jgi:hypothetical protein